MLTKTRSVLSHKGQASGDLTQKFQPDEPPFDRTVWLSWEDWDDMGRPDTITVTIEPGDRLNEEGST